MSFVPRHLNPGEFYHRRDDIGAQDIGFVLSRLDAGVPPSHIARQAGRCILDIQKIIDDFERAPVPLCRDLYAAPRRREGCRWHTALEAGCTFSLVAEIPTYALSARLGPTIAPVLVSMKAIVAYIARKHHLRAADILGQSRRKSIAVARQEAMWLMVQQGRWSLPQIGIHLGDRDHTTVIHGNRRHQERLDAAAALRLAA